MPHRARQSSLPAQPLGITLPRKLDRHQPVQPRIPRLKHLAHSARPQRLQDLERTNCLAGLHRDQLSQRRARIEMVLLVHDLSRLIDPEQIRHPQLCACNECELRFAHNRRLGRIDVTIL